jgi:hypothetical protein
VDGQKPYMLYRQAGGTGVVAENASGGGPSPERCEQPIIVCSLIDVKSMVAEMEWAMMYDDAHADWGHRDTIINPDYDTVNNGIAFNDHQFTFYEHFEYIGLTYVTEPVLENNVLRFRARPVDEHKIGSISVYYDPPTTPKTPDEISLLESYCTGGGFTDDCDDVSSIAQVLKPAPPGSFYSDLAPTKIVADVWSELDDGSVQIEADLGNLVSRPGVYTISIMSASGDHRRLGLYSIVN